MTDLTQVLGGLAALIAGVVAAWNRVKWWTRPRLWVHWDEKRTGEWRRTALRGAMNVGANVPLINSGSAADLTTTPGVVHAEAVLAVAGHPPQQWRWFHVQVCNGGARNAIDCKGFIEKVEVWADTRFSRHPGWVGRMELQWANTGGKTINDVPPGCHSGERLDVLRVSPSSPYTHLVSPQVMTGLPVQLPRGKYRILVALYQGDARRGRCLLEVEWDADPNTIAIRQVPLELLSLDS